MFTFTIRNITSAKELKSKGMCPMAFLEVCYGLQDPRVKS